MSRPYLTLPTLVGALILSASTSLAAQTASTPVAPTPVRRDGEIRGRVASAAGDAPIADIATVEARLDGASAGLPAARAVTDAQGTFRFRGLAPGRYRVSVRALGFAPRALSAEVHDGATSVADLGTIAMQPAPVALQSVAVTAERRAAELSPDRNVFVVKDMPATRGGTALDVLRNVPAVDVDVDDVVSLRGSSAVVVQINGRPSPLTGAQLGSFLGQLSADMVERIEVIPNPSARDDPEGAAGIINIVLKKKTDVGTSGSVSAGAGTTGHADVGASVGQQRGPLSAYGSYAFLRDSRPRDELVFRQDRTHNPITLLDDSGVRTQIPLVHTLTGNTTLAATAHDDLSLDAVYSTRVEYETFDVRYRDLTAARELTGLSDRYTRGVNHEFTLEGALGWEHAFAGDGHKLAAELSLDRNGEGGPTAARARTFALDGTAVDTTALERARGYQRPWETALKLDYARSLGVLHLEGGYKGTLQRIATILDTRVFDDALGAYRPDSTRISDFTYRQLVNAAYAQVGAQAGPLRLQGGVRVERATTRFAIATSGAAFRNGYNSVFPSALVAWDVDDARQLKLSYSTRIRRPDDTDQLDPSLHFLDPLNVSRGNPYLQPEYVHALELGVQQTAAGTTLQLTPFFRRTTGAVRTLRTLDSAGVTTRTFANVATSDSYGTDATLALHGGRLGGFAGASLFRQVSDAANLGAGLSARTLGWSTRANASYRVNHGLDLQALGSYQAPMTVEQGRVGARARLSLAARQKLEDDRLSLTLRVTDPFGTLRERSITDDPTFYQESDRLRHVRGVQLNATWIFGHPPKERDREPVDAGDGGGGGGGA